MAKKKSNPEPNKNKQGKAAIEKAKADRLNLWIAAAIIAVLTIIVYLPVFHNGFVNLDDDRYIEKQPLIKVFDFKALFTQYVMGNYHPFVMTVYTILYHFYQYNPNAYHTVNLAIHLINTVLVLWLLYYITGSFQVSVIVSLLFGIHPLHVESVAWASELKDLMYTFGFLSSLIFYVRYARLKIKQEGQISKNVSFDMDAFDDLPVKSKGGGKATRLYIFCLVFFIFSLFSKGMGVSLAIVIFLIDFYLGRKFTRNSLVEKIPFLALALLFGYIAYKAQQSLGAIQEITLFSPLQRIVFACYGFLTYIQRIFLPFDLCAYYPYPVKTNNTIPGFYYAYPVILLALLNVVFYTLKINKKVFFGIGFFAITVALVLQLLPVGGAITADRYSYIPSIGIFFLIAEAIVYLANKGNYKGLFNGFTLGIVAVLTVFFSFLTFNQVKLWKDGMTLWSNVIKNYQTVSLAYNNRGVLYKNAGELDKAMSDYTQSLILDPKNSDSWSNKGLIFWQEALNTPSLKVPLTDSALMYVNKAIEIKPDFATAYGNKGSILSTMGNQEGAIEAFTKSIELDPYFAESYYNRGIVKYNLGRKGEACPDLKQAADLGYVHSADAFRDLCK